MKILVTGAGGFVGKYLLRTLLEHKHDVTAIGINNGSFLKDMGITTYVVNITDYDVLYEAMKNEMPDAVIHLAAISNIPLSWANPALTVNVNVNGSINVLNALQAVNSKAKFLFIGSSDEYGMTAKSGVPLTEDMPCLPQNPYAISKYCAEQMLLKLGKKYDMNIICTRSFNHFGPGQAQGFAVADFASQIAAIERNEQPPTIRVGNLSAARDFTYVQDIVNAYIGLIEKDVDAGVYNICSNNTLKIQNILDILVSLSNTKINIVVDEEKLRPIDVPFFAGCYDKIKKATGWKPKCNYAEGLEKVLQSWR